MDGKKNAHTMAKVKEFAATLCMKKPYQNVVNKAEHGEMPFRKLGFKGMFSSNLYISKRATANEITTLLISDLKKSVLNRLRLLEDESK